MNFNLSTNNQYIPIYRNHNKSIYTVFTPLLFIITIIISQQFVQMYFNNYTNNNKDNDYPYI